VTETLDHSLTEVQLPRPDDARFRAWVAFLRAHAGITRRLESELRAERDLGLAEYDALVQLALADSHRLHMSDLAERVLLSRSGVSRLVDRLEASGLVVRAACREDARVSWATLTDAGLARVREASPAHFRGVEAHFLARIPEADRESFIHALETVVEALGAPIREQPPAVGSPRA